ncbi:hypothetical protein AtubIFM61612_007944 [Aspergillus tubingensis]|uniref:Similar to An04g09840 n=1 Tax=Aspergillus niger TaxID=5061 RepID=A0A124BW93_ASPNG|nr:similar to An04g09840 [Aspergillus niger]GLA97343.1 hypothetical protein AtubIFM57143_004833 [Aspergillus tubingensis]GLB18054.1 hypothetical protein AtubIFM61612_007944 [Aspergillus tubingensis]
MSIACLPIELVRKICTYLQLPAWCALRLTCRSLYNITFDSFRRVFRSISVLCTSGGLCQLYELSMHEDIRQHVEELRLVPELFNGEYEMHPYGFAYWDCIRLALKKQRQQQSEEEHSALAHISQYYQDFHFVMKDHRRILKSPTAIRVLRHCMGRFVNLTTVGLRYRPAEGSRNSICLGWRSLTDDLGFPPKFPQEFRRHESISREQDRAFCVLVRALIASGQNVKHLSTCGKPCYGVALARLKLTQKEWTSFVSLMKGLLNLHLCLEGTREGDHPERPRELLTAVGPTLEVLRYQFDSINASYPPTTFPILEIFPGIQFPRLREVRLQNLVAPPEALMEFLRAVSPTLTDLILKGVSLAQPDDPYGPLPQEDTPWETKHHWQHVLKSFRDELSLHFLVLQAVMFKRNVLEIADETYTWGPPHNQDTAAYNVARTGLSFQDWVNQLRLN